MAELETLVELGKGAPTAPVAGCPQDGSKLHWPVDDSPTAAVGEWRQRWSLTVNTDLVVAARRGWELTAVVGQCRTAGNGSTVDMRR